MASCEVPPPDNFPFYLYYVLIWKKCLHFIRIIYIYRFLRPSVAVFLSFAVGGFIQCATHKNCPYVICGQRRP